MAVKHVGRLTTNNRKLVVVYRVIPGDPENCLVIHSENLEAADHDSLMTLVQGEAGQNADELSELMARSTLADGRNMLGAFHNMGKLTKVPTNIVEMTPSTQSSINLSELNKIIAEQKGVSIEDLAVAPQVPQASASTTTAPSGEVDTAVPVSGEEPLTDEQLAAQYRSQADSLFKEAKRLREQAEELVPTKRKSKVAADA
mgnify:CR=1 FL=1